MLTLRNKMKITLVAVFVILLFVNTAFSKNKQGGKSRSQRQGNKASQVRQSNKAPNQNQSVQPQSSQAPNQTRSAVQRNSSVGAPRRAMTPKQIAPVSGPARTRSRVQDPLQKGGRSVVEKRQTRRIAKPQVARPDNNVDSPRQVDNKTVVPIRVEAPRKVEIAKPTPKIRQPEPVVEKKITPSEPVDSIKKEPRNRQRPDRTERILPQNPTKEIVPEPAARDDKSVSRKGRGPDRDENRTDRNFKRRGDTNREVAEPTRNTELTGNIEPRQTEKSVELDRRVRPERSDGGHRRRSDFRRGEDRGMSRPKVERNSFAVENHKKFGRGYHGSNHEVRNRGRIWGHHPRRIYNRVIWPSYYYPIYYSCGPRVFFNYVRPYYHRKYVFVSIGGWWPYYSSVRYYWYGYHPYYWYGSYPDTYEVTGNTYNYYYYNTYTTEQTAATELTPPLAGVDESTFADVRERLEQQAQQEPQPQTSADFLFEDGVNAFENGEYSAAARAFSEAMAVEQNDLVLPFAYAQALFADEKYYQAADVIRTALANLPPDQEGIFFPRGLYREDDILLGQIERLEKMAGVFTVDADMNLLLAYQYIGVEKYEQAEQVLRNASMHEKNSEANAVLLRLIEKIREQSQSKVNI